jgi:CheY-like chemotaxis protein
MLGDMHPSRSSTADVGAASLAALAHEMRNALSPLVSAAQLLSVQPENAEQVHELASVILRQSEQLTGLINSFHGMSREAPIDGLPTAPTTSATSEKLTQLSSARNDATGADATLPRWRVLVVDDAPAAARLLQRLLEKLNQNVRVAHHADSALEQLPHFKPNLVISDIAMPGASGYELARRIRALTAIQQPRLIALSGYDQDDDRDKARQAGFDGYLCKPVDLSALKTLLESLPTPSECGDLSPL